MRMRSIWKGVVLAENDDTVAVEASQYFPRTSLSKEYFFASDHRSTCPWKALASYLSVSLGARSTRMRPGNSRVPRSLHAWSRIEWRSGVASASSASTRPKRQRVVHERCRGG